MDFTSDPRTKECYICHQTIEVMEPKLEIKHHTVHKECFRCCVCDEQLKPGFCSIDDNLCKVQSLFKHFGLIRFCTDHMNLGPGEKLQKLNEKMKTGGH